MQKFKTIALSWLIIINSSYANESFGEIKNNLTTNSIKLEELFYNKHLGSNYNPIKLEASVHQPVEVNLEYILAESLQSNINLQIAQQDSILAKWKFWKQFSEALPDIQLGARKKDMDGTFFLNSNFASPINEQQSQAQFRVNYRVFDGGTKTFLTLAERFYKKASSDDEQESYNFTLLEAVRYYNDLLSAQVALNSKLKAFENAQSNLDLAQKFYKAGTGTKFDIAQAEANLARVQEQLITQEADFRISEINLAQHLDMPLLTPLKVRTEELEQYQIINDELEIEEFIDIAMEENPKIKAALKRKRGALREGLAKAGLFLPKLDVYADFTGTGTEFSDLNRITTLGVEATIELGEGLGLKSFSNAMESKALVKKARLQYKQEMTRIEKELRLAFLEYQKSKSLVEASEKELIASKEALRLAKLRYQNGLEILTNVLEKESELGNAELKYIKSVTNSNYTQSKLAYYMGDISTEQLVHN